MFPYDEFEKQVKEVVALIDEPIRLIDQQIKEVEEQKKVEKKGKILEVYEGMIGTLKGVVPFEKLFRPEYLNMSKSMKSITEELTETIQRINNDLDTIEGFGSKYELQIKDAYLRTLDLSFAMREKARLEEVEMRLKEKKEAEERREEERKAAKQESLQAEQSPITEEESQPEDSAKNNGTVQQEEKQEEKFYQMDFRVWGTREQIMGLRQYLIDNKIKFGKVE